MKSKEMKKKTYRIIKWFKHKSTDNIFAPLIDIDGNKSIYLKIYCSCCKMWLLNKFRSFFIDQYLATLSHKNLSLLNKIQKNFNFSCFIRRKANINNRKSMILI